MSISTVSVVVERIVLRGFQPVAPQNPLLQMFPFRRYWPIGAYKRLYEFQFYSFTEHAAGCPFSGMGRNAVFLCRH
ncbi:hypothetical protein Krac_0790 [Ktedonobacter racemifer DSM 44963]|uniref:Uncharacterized protein n=1 Tax=Ktedonobacter racemifer DSM 44963 TaxID=485913 RepID=D6U8K1_KTERA|nr:hypothetical protein Krac_0790 [Ktedonobacter racemifer DSM 44963]